MGRSFVRVTGRILRLLRSVRSPQAVGRLAAYAVTEAWYEWRLRIHTLGYLTREELGVADRSVGYYAPTAYWDFRRAMRRLAVRPGEDVFLDVGSGMGRVVVMAALHPFRRVVGVELSERLTDVARRNVAQVQGRLACRDVTLVAADATAWEIPGDVTEVYLYNPFRRELLRRLFENLRRSLAGAPRELRVVYKNPVYFEQDVGAVPWLEPIDGFTCLTGHRCTLYRADAAAAAAGPPLA
jgi:SAM-dependent methyltransferase